MAGIWEHIKQDSTNRLKMHTLEAVFEAYFVHQVDPTRGMTRAELKAWLQSEIEGNFDSQSLQDLDGMADTVDTLLGRSTEVGIPPNTTFVHDAGVYIRNLTWLCRAAEDGVIDETRFRADANI